MSKDIVRKLKKDMSRRQLIALQFPVLLGHQDKAKNPRFIECWNVNGRTWHKRLTFDFNGGPELVGPCWHVEVWCVDADDDKKIITARWSLADQAHAKYSAINGIKNVGAGSDVDVLVDETSLHIYRLAKVLEAAIAQTVGTI